MKNVPTIQEMLSIGEGIVGHVPGRMLSGEVVKMTDKAIFVHYRWDICHPSWGGAVIDFEYNYEVWIPKSVLEVKKLKCEGNHYLVEIKNWFMKKGFEGRDIRKAKRA